jgi:hypothetical protein
MPSKLSWEAIIADWAKVRQDESGEKLHRRNSVQMIKLSQSEQIRPLHWTTSPSIKKTGILALNLPIETMGTGKERKYSLLLLQFVEHVVNCMVQYMNASTTTEY